MSKDPRELRNKVRDYLRRLLDDRKAETMRNQDLGRTDPMKVSTGQTALDTAVIQAEELIRSLDRILENKPPEIHTFRTTCNGLSRLKTSKCA